MKLLFIAVVFFLGLVIPFTAYAHETIKPFPILMQDNGFFPTTFSIPVGSTAVFKNVGKKLHWPASNIHPTHEIYPEFDPKKPIQPGEDWTFTFTKIGSWRFHDHLHPEFTGTVTITEKKTSHISNEKDGYLLWDTRPGIGKLLMQIKTNLFKMYAFVFRKQLDKDFLSQNIFKIVQDKTALTFWLTVVGPTNVLHRLEDTVEEGTNLQCHRQAHTIGRGAYALYGIKAFKEGNEGCSSGYYHGVMEAFIREKSGTHMQKDITDVCQTFDTKLSQFHCYHGAGHGIMAYYDNDLPKAIETCQLIYDVFGKGACISAVFMENIVVATTYTQTGHHTKWLNTDPQFPCTYFKNHQYVQSKCYEMQTTWMLYLYHNDFNAVLAECLRAPEEMQVACFNSFGRDVGLYTFRDNQKTLMYCNKLKNNKTFYTACITGVLYDIVSFKGEDTMEKGKTFCDKVNEESRKDCYTILEIRRQILKKI